MHEINCTIIMTSLLFVVNNNSHYIAFWIPNFKHFEKTATSTSTNSKQYIFVFSFEPWRIKNQVSLASSLSTRKKIDILLRAFHQALWGRFAWCSLCHSFIWWHHSLDITRHAKGSAHLAKAETVALLLFSRQQLHTLFKVLFSTVSDIWTYHF